MTMRWRQKTRRGRCAPLRCHVISTPAADESGTGNRASDSPRPRPRSSTRATAFCSNEDTRTSSATESLRRACEHFGIRGVLSSVGQEITIGSPFCRASLYHCDDKTPVVKTRPVNDPTSTRQSFARPFRPRVKITVQCRAKAVSPRRTLTRRRWTMIQRGDDRAT
jgi:hypothetical protein